MINLKKFQTLNSVVIANFKPKPTSISENQEEATIQLWVSKDGKTQIGVGECTPGEFTADRSKDAEYCHILFGSASVLNQNYTEGRKLSSGDLLVLPIGWKGSRIIHEHVRELSVLQSP